MERGVRLSFRRVHHIYCPWDTNRRNDYTTRTRAYRSLVAGAKTLLRHLLLMLRDVAGIKQTSQEVLSLISVHLLDDLADKVLVDDTNIATVWAVVRECQHGVIGDLVAVVKFELVDAKSVRVKSQEVPKIAS